MRLNRASFVHLRSKKDFVCAFDCEMNICQFSLHSIYLYNANLNIIKCILAITAPIVQKIHMFFNVP